MTNAHLALPLFLVTLVVFVVTIRLRTLTDQEQIALRRAQMGILVLQVAAMAAQVGLIIRHH